MIRHLDMMNHEVKISKDIPLRIVSLVPSQTELLHYLGLDIEVVGITYYCVHPKSWRSKDKVGGTKKLKREKIHGLKPTLIIGNKEENLKEDILYLKEHYPVWISDIKTINDALLMIEAIAILCNKEALGKELVHEIQESFKNITNHINGSVAYVIWKDPLMLAGGDTFINSMLEHAGSVNVLKQQNRYPETTIESLQKLNPNYIFLSSEPYPFKTKHLDYFQSEFPNSTVVLVDGELFSWYGPRLLLFNGYLNHLFLK